MSALRPFHLAIPVNNINETTRFYTEILGCKIGRSATRWVDFDFLGHQLSAHLVDEPSDIKTNSVDGDEVPCRHFGVVLEWQQWNQLKERLLKFELGFLIEPRIRFEGQLGEQATMFFEDPSGNAIEFKSFKDPEALFQSS